MRVRTLDATQITIGQHTIGIDQPTIFVCLFLLACSSPRPVSRAQLAGELWPATEPHQRNHRLRSLLHRIRQLEAPILCDHATVTLAERPTIDFREYSTLPVSLADIETRAARIGVVLPGLDALRAVQRGDYLDDVREVIVATMTRWLDSALQLTKRAGEWRLVASLAESARAIDPQNHIAWLTLAEAQCLTGDRERALGTIDEYLALVPQPDDVGRLSACELRRRIVSEARESNEPPLIGRDAVMRRIWTSVARAERGHGGGLLLWGNAGIGKTRLLREVERGGSAIRGRVLPFAAQAVHALQPLGLTRDLVTRLLDEPGAAGCDPDAYHRLREFAAPDARRNPSFERLPAELVFQSIVDLLVAILDESPLVITIDDVHLLHASGWPMWRALLHWSTAQPLLWVFAARALHESDLQRLPEAALLPRVPLPELDGRDQPMSSSPISAAMIAF